MIGLVQTYIGGGKGKTTAAVGQSIRAVGAGKRVYFAQFLKDDTGNELKILKTLSGITVAKAPHRLPFYFQMTDQQKRDYNLTANTMLDEAINAAYLNRADMVVLDEVLDAVDLEIIDIKKLVEFIKNKPRGMELVLTGHNAIK